MATIKIPCIPAVQPIGSMYVCVMDSVFLRKITFADTRRATDSFNTIEEYIGIQRELDPKRKKEIGKYVNLSDATFPNSIILTISSEFVFYNETERMLEIQEEAGIASVLDGQHRIAGLEYYNGNKFDCIVTIFIDMEMEDQAVIFSTINTEQKKVNKSLVADLYELYQTRNPQRTCHNIARLLATNKQSPFYTKISTLGAANKMKGESLTQYIFVRELLAHISKSPLEDRDIMKQKDFWGNNRKLSLKPEELERTCLRKLFIEDESDLKITQIIINYFKAIKNKWPKSWDADPISNSILNKSTGFIALMKFFKTAYLHIKKDEPSYEDFNDLIFSKIKLNDDSFTSDKYPSGAVGENNLLKELKSFSV